MALLLTTDFSPAEQAQWLGLLRAALPDERILGERPPGDEAAIDIALVANPLSGALQGLTGLRLIQSLWAGVDRLLADTTVPVDVPLARMVDPAMNASMAETALWAVLSLQRGFFGYAAQQRAQCWRAHALRHTDETPVAVLGLGEMGRAVAQRLRANGYPVQGWSRHARPVPGVVVGAGEAALEALLASAQVVINLLPLTPDTRGLLNHEVLSGMRRGAALVNLGRGAHVVDADLLAALDSGHLGHAVLDVFRQEPLPGTHPFWVHPRVTVLPHVAAPTDPRSAVAIVAANVAAWRSGTPLAHLVDRVRGY
jgi:glyoxylate/hydroxypyruvate reductase A